MNPCLIPVPKKDIVGDNRWDSMHRRYVSEARNTEVEVVLIGDSIIQQLQLSNLWNDFTALHCLNFGIGGDRVENVLWRLIGGELNFASEIRAIVLFVGTNNTDDCSAEEIFDGIVNIVTFIRERLGKGVHILLPTLLPRGQFPNPTRNKLNTINRLMLEKFSSEQAERIYVIEIDKDLLQIDDTISHHIMHDYLHLTDEGYNRTFRKVYEKLQLLLNMQL